MESDDLKHFLAVARTGSLVKAAHALKSSTAVEPFITGFIADNNYVGRPVDVQPMKDGSLLISDDFAGAVYRVTYGSARTAGAR